jgi:hypothetical protein
VANDDATNEDLAEEEIVFTRDAQKATADVAEARRRLESLRSKPTAADEPSELADEPISVGERSRVEPIGMTQVHAQSDIIWGVKSIADEIRRPERATYHLLETGQLPANKIGGRWVASRRKLMARLVGGETA